MITATTVSEWSGDGGALIQGGFNAWVRDLRRQLQNGKADVESELRGCGMRASRMWNQSFADVESELLKWKFSIRW